MDTAKKQTVVVEVMALVGGHLLLPKVKLSKYIPADHHTSHQGHTDEPSPRAHLAASTQINASPNDTRSSQAVTKDDNKSVLVTSSNEKTSSVGGKKMRFIFSNSMFDFGHLAIPRMSLVNYFVCYFDFASFLQVLKLYTCIEVKEVLDTNEADIVPRTIF